MSTYSLILCLLRFLHSLKEKVGNKAHPEGSICESYILQETSTFTSYYFESHVQSRRTRVPRNDEGSEDQLVQPISIFNQHGRAAGPQKRKFIVGKEKDAAHLHVLLNCEEVDPYQE